MEKGRKHSDPHKLLYYASPCCERVKDFPLVKNFLVLSMVVLVVDSGNSIECVKALNAVCSAAGILCYDPSDDIEPLISLTWIETLSYLESFKECVEDPDCAKNVLNSFGHTLRLALEKNYVFTIDIERVARISGELKNTS